MIYLRNTPASVGHEVKGTRLVEEAPVIISTTLLAFSDIERAFYDEAARRAGIQSNVFGARMDNLRQLCCHPAVASGWAERLVKEVAPGRVLSLDELRQRMVGWKDAEIERARSDLSLLLRNINAAREVLAMVVDKFPSLVDGKVEAFPST